MDKALGLKKALMHTFKNRSFLAFVISNLFIQFAFTMDMLSYDLDEATRKRLKDKLGKVRKLLKRAERRLNNGGIAYEKEASSELPGR